MMEPSNTNGGKISKMVSEIVNINGRKYDKHTGMPLSESAKSSPDHHAASVHSRTAKSKTLDRRYVKRAAAVKRTASSMDVVAPAKSTPAQPLVTKLSPRVKPSASIHTITKFAPRKSPVKNIDGMTRPAVHPMVQKVNAARPMQSDDIKRIHKPSDVIKAEAIDTALASAPSHGRDRHKEPKSPATKRRQRMSSLAAAGTALLLLGGYFTYLNMPNLSVRVAAVRAGIDATYPSYRPSGYSISGPVAYDNGKVQMTFASNGTTQSFQLSQERSGWDSNAVLEDYVSPKAGDNYAVTSEAGLTIYTWDGNAAWVSGGILYTVTGDNNISPDQIRHMAASM